MQAFPFLILLPLAALCTAAGATPQTLPKPLPDPLAQSQPASVPTQGDAQGLSVVRDPETGRLRAPTPAEMRALQGAGAARLQPPAQPAMVTGADGRRHVRLGERALVYSLIQRGADGQLDQHCVNGIDAAERALNQPVRNNADKEARHDHR